MTAPVSPVSCATELVFHGLAWLAVGSHPASLWDPRYHSFARERLPAECNALFIDDGAVLGRRFVDRDLVAWHALPAMFEQPSEIRAFAKTLTVNDPRAANIVAHCMKRDSEATEWFALDLAFAAPSFERAFERVVLPVLTAGCDSLAPWIERALRIDPALSAFRVELSCVLGGRGRALGEDRLFTGALTEWSDHDLEHSVVQLLHERAVRGAGDVDYVCAEWSALVSLARRLEGTEFERAHAHWIARHELTPLVAKAIERGYAAATQCEGIVFGSIDGASALRRCPEL